MSDITARLAEELLLAHTQLDMCAGCIERGYLTEALLHASAMTARRKAALAAYESERVGWQPIETAPKYVDVLLCCPRAGVVRGRWQPDTYTNKPRPYWTHDRERTRGVRETRADQPTHWQPLPAPVQP